MSSQVVNPEERFFSGEKPSMLLLIVMHSLFFTLLHKDLTHYILGKFYAFLLSADFFQN